MILACRRAGYTAFMDRQQERGADFAHAAKQKSYQLAPRATIFRRDAGSVEGLASLKRLMRSNAFSTDPVSSFPAWMYRRNCGKLEDPRGSCVNAGQLCALS